MSKNACNTWINARGNCKTVPEGKASRVLNENWKGRLFYPNVIESVHCLVHCVRAIHRRLNGCGQ